MPELDSNQLPRYHDSSRHMVDAMDVPRREGAVFHGDPRDRDRHPEHLLQCERVQSGSIRPIGLGPRQRIWLSYALGSYFGIGEPVSWSSTSLNQRFALSYTANGWNLTANVVYGIQADSITNRPQISPCPAPFGLNGCNADFINVDLTATKKFGKWEFGAVAYGSTDLTRPILNYQKQSDFAVGGLVGYDFGPLTLQAYATTEVYERNYGGRDTRGWLRMIIPLWKPEAAPQRPLITK